MTTPTVRELPRTLQPTSRDDFADDVSEAATPAVASRPRPGAPVRRPLTAQSDLGQLVCAARAGDEVAWSRLVERFDRQLRNIARRYRLSEADVDEVLQVTWLQLLENIRGIRDPTAVGAWLTTAARRNAVRRRQMHVREVLSGDPDLGQRADADGPEARLSVWELRRCARKRARRPAGRRPAAPDRAVDAAGARLPRDRRALSMPVGSIGPSRARALTRLARDPDLRAVSP